MAFSWSWLSAVKVTVRDRYLSPLLSRPVQRYLGLGKVPAEDGDDGSGEGLGIEPHHLYGKDAGELDHAGLHRSFWIPHFLRFSQSDLRVMPSISASCCSLNSRWYFWINALV